MRLAHLSDAHIGPLPRAQRWELFGKRFTGYLNWKRGRALIHDMTTLGRIVADIKAHHPDHIAMTGDIINIGLRAEFPQARQWLATLGAADEVSFVPGNHDTYSKGTMPDLVATFAPWTHGDDGTTSHYPYLRRRGGIALIGLCSGVPTPPFVATGRLGPAQSAALAKLLNDCAAEDLVRVVFVHHPPHQGGATFGRTLLDAVAFEKIIAACGAELILHGHNHRPSLARIAGPKKSVPVVGVASASAIRGTSSHRAGYNLFDIEGTLKDYRIKGRMRGIRLGSKEIIDLGAIDL